MNSWRGKATRTPSKTSAATFKVSTQSAKRPATKPAPGKPALEKPAREKPTPTKPAPEKRAPEKPTPTKPAPEKRALEKPARTKRALQKPAPEKPAPEKAAREKPTPTKPAPEKRALEKRALEKPALEKPARTKPAQQKPAPEKPAPEKPARTKPAQQKPAPEKPARKKPARTKPAPEKPAQTKPAQQKSAPVKPAPEKPAQQKPAQKLRAPTKPAPEKPARKKSTQEKPSESLVVFDAALPKDLKCGFIRASGSQQKKSVPGPQQRPQAHARGAPKAPLSAEDFLDGQVILAEPSADLGPPLPKAGSRRERGARSARERKSQPWPEEVPGSWKPRAVLDKLRLSSCEISATAEVVNKLVDHLLRTMQSHPSAFKGVKKLCTGSYYEQVKVSSPNEFDIMFKLDVPRIELEEYHNSGAHYFVKFKRNPKGNPLSQFLENEVLSASKMLSKFREIIKEEIKNIEDLDVIMERKKRGCPAVTLLIRKPKEISVDIILALQVKSSWPASTLEGLCIQGWLGRKVRRDLRLQPFYLVPKHAKEEGHFQEDTWRLSFSHIEKDILKNHGQCKTCCETDGVRCCRKDCLKLMKYLLEQLKKKHGHRKELKKFCSYHVKTAFFHACTHHPEDSQWQPGDLELCFDRCLEGFLQCLREEHLTNYFIPGHNLFSQDKVDKISREFLLKEIEYERNNGFPVFKES
ncbi:cyclic GMP-AMP synthase-like [Phyllostomus hastatus]|uniref:cyclic GMP-AMP synthase-like n=1 Tax=Phyllostomus hastatus TaxID=9423 RepID=UPI001E67F1DF|nr:cyclic GMP-AMP synthase-like [Phyllostomus hastatus]